MWSVSTLTSSSVNWSFRYLYGWSVTSESRLKIGVLQRMGQYAPNFHVEGDVPPLIIFAARDSQMNSSQHYRWQFFTQRNFVADILQAKCDFSWKTAVLRFWDPFRGLVATSEYRLKIGDFAPTGAGWPKISGRRGHPTNHSSSQKTRLTDLSYGI